MIEIDLMPIEAAGEGAPLIASEGPMTWLATRFETPDGPRHAHRFGPFPDNAAAWLSLDGFAKPPSR